MAFDVAEKNPNAVPLTDRTLLAGDWLVEGGGYVIEISSDGAYVVAGHADLLVDRGQWTLRGSELTLTSSARSAGCDAGDRLVLTSLAGEVLTNIGAQDLQGDVTQNTCDGAWAKSVWVPIPNSRPADPRATGEARRPGQIRTA